VGLSLNTLAALYLTQGKLAAAEPLVQRAPRIYEATLRHDLPNVAASLNNLAALYQTQGK
jgi:hypothetical protein